MRILRLVFAVVVLTASAAAAQEIRVAPKLREGDTFRLEVTRLREQTQRPQTNGRGTTPIDVRVVSATPEGFVLDWAAGTPTFENPLVAADPLAKAITEAAAGLSLRLKLNADGEFAGLANESQVRTKLTTILDVMRDQLAARLPADQREQMQAMLRQVLAPDLALGTVSREVGLYFFLNGVELTVGKPVEVDIEQPAPFGGGVIPARLRIQADAVTEHVASLSTATTYQAAALLNMTRALAQQAGTTISDEELAKIPPLEMRDSGKYTFDRVTGLMREVTIDRHVNAGPNRRHDGWIIRLVTPPAR